jgi:hypothetical protein
MDVKDQGFADRFTKLQPRIKALIARKNRNRQEEQHCSNRHQNWCISFEKEK